ncbi:hypothetical protein [Streptomyces sp. 900105245]
MTDFGGVIAHTALVRPATRAGAATDPPHDLAGKLSTLTSSLVTA